VTRQKAKGKREKAKGKTAQLPLFQILPSAFSLLPCHRVPAVVTGGAVLGMSFQFSSALNTMLNSPWFCHR